MIDNSPSTTAEALSLVESGNALEDAGQVLHALEQYSQAARLAPGLARVHVNRGNALLSLGKLNEAWAAYRLALDLDPEYVSAYYNLGNVELREGRPANAAAMYRRAAELRPGFIEAEIALANALAASGNLEAAARCLHEVVSRYSDSAGAHAHLGQLLAQLGRPTEAAYNLGRAFSLDPGNLDLLLPLASATRLSGNCEAAVPLYVRAAAAFPENATIQMEIGGALLECGRTQQAIAAYRCAADAAPGLAIAHYNLGTALHSAGESELAIASLRKAVACDPMLTEAHINLASALRAMGRDEDVVAVYRAALRTAPMNANLHRSLADALHVAKAYEEAMSSYRRALELAPDMGEARLNLGNVFKDARRFEDALDVYGSVPRGHAQYPAAQHNIGTLMLDIGRVEGASAAYRNVLSVAPGHLEAHTGLLFALAHDDSVLPDELFAEHRRYGDRFTTLPHIQHAKPRQPDRPLRVGFVSGDLRDHSVAYFLEPILPHLGASSSLVLSAYSTHEAEDAVSARMRTHFDLWRNVSRMSDEDLAKTIAGDGVDFLIDLSGHTARHRLPVFARKPAPLQASWMGYPATTGLLEMDYYIGDALFLPIAEFERHFTERFIHLPAYTSFKRDSRAPGIAALPALRHGYITFGSFNRVNKIRSSTVALWCRLMRALPDSRLLLGAMVSRQVSQSLIEHFAEGGVARNRIRVEERCGQAEYFALHNYVDICLDTLPYSGGTTTPLALSMGVPTLTLAGMTAAGRQSVATMSNYGLAEFVAHDEDDFVGKGVSLVSDLSRLAALRASMLRRMEEAHKTRPDVVGQALARSIRKAWRRWCAGLPVAHIVEEE